MRSHHALVTVCLVACNALSGAAGLTIDGDAGVPLTIEAGAGDSAADTSPLPEAAPGPDPDDGGVPEDAPDAVAPLDADASGGKLLVFVTSTSTAGTFGSVTAGDNLCQLRANAAGHPGKFVAWLSRSGIDAYSRVTSPGPWYLVAGGVAVSSPSELRSAAGIALAVDRDENGVLIAGSAWTGSTAGVYDNHSCAGWTLADGGGTYGSVTATSALWQTKASSICTVPMHLYCFQN